MRYLLRDREHEERKKALPGLLKGLFFALKSGLQTISPAIPSEPLSESVLTHLRFNAERFVMQAMAGADACRRFHRSKASGIPIPEYAFAEAGEPKRVNRTNAPGSQEEVRGLDDIFPEDQYSLTLEEALINRGQGVSLRCTPVGIPPSQGYPLENATAPPPYLPVAAELESECDWFSVTEGEETPTYVSRYLRDEESADIVTRETEARVKQLPPSNHPPVNPQMRKMSLKEQLKLESELEADLDGVDYMVRNNRILSSSITNLVEEYFNRAAQEDDTSYY